MYYVMFHSSKILKRKSTASSRYTTKNYTMLNIESDLFSKITQISREYYMH